MRSNKKWWLERPRPRPKRHLFNMQELVKQGVITKDQMLKYQAMLTSRDEELDNLATIQLQEIWKQVKSKNYDNKT